MDKLGSYITKLMLTISDKDEKNFLRELALEELKKLSEDLSHFIFNWIDEVETLSTKWPITQEEEDEAEKRMDIIGQNGNDGLHYSKNENQMELEL